MLKNKLLPFVAALTASTFLFAETNVEIYKIPLGSFMQIENEKDIEALDKHLQKTKPLISYKEDSKDRMLQYGDIKVFLKNNANKKENYNRLLDIVSDFAKEVDGLDQKIVRKTLDRLKAQ